MSTAVFLASAPLTVFNNTGAGGSIIEWGKETWQHNTAIRFAVSGIMGNAFFFAIDRALFPIIINTAKRLTVSNVSKWTIQNAASVSFFVAYLLDIAIQHLFNAWLVFGLDTISTRQLYLSSLFTSYTAYFGTLCGSTILQAYLLQRGIAKGDAFWITIALGSIVNYVVLTTLNNIAANKKAGDDTNYNKSHIDTKESKSNRGIAMIPIWGTRRRGRGNRNIHYFTSHRYMKN